MLKSSLRQLFGATSRRLAPVYLDAPFEGVTRQAWAGVRALGWQVRRRFGAVDRQLIAQALAMPGPHKLHLGCGEHRLPGWINADFLPAAADVVHIDATRRFPLPDASVDYAYSEHMIEHLEYPDAMSMLRECARVLRPGGRLRISTPDLQALLALWQGEPSALQRQFVTWSTERFIDWAPYPDRAFVLNHFVRSWGHQFIFDRDTLVRGLQDAGFVDIAACEEGQSADPVLRGLENAGRMPPGLLALQSMTFEARKPPTA